MKSMNDQYKRTTAAAILVILMGAGMALGLSNKCKILSQHDCIIIWGLAVSAIIGGIILAEAFVIYRIDRFEQQMANSSETEVKQQLPSRHIWLRSAIRLLIATLLLGLPVIIQSAFVAASGGLFIGFGIDFLVRGILNRLPPIY